MMVLQKKINEVRVLIPGIKKKKHGVCVAKIVLKCVLRIQTKNCIENIWCTDNFFFPAFITNFYR